MMFSVHLNEITSNTQSKRGNRSFLCNINNIIYTSYSSGYIRRTVKNSKGEVKNYQLNRINRKTGKRIMINNEMLRIIELRYYANIYAQRAFGNI